ncbi:hypothetical protein JW756_07180 [Candidatus Woesearchaeota archaeon]|nr:hypothetical protein [Candidatus Woesearchaeota archaeon]
MKDKNKQMRTISIIIVVLLVLTLLTNLVLFFFLKSRGGITGFSVTSSKSIAFENDVIEINKADLSSCCSFINDKGEEDHCYVLKDYDCSYCSDYCK